MYLVRKLIVLILKSFKYCDDILRNLTFFKLLFLKKLNEIKIIKIYVIEMIEYRFYAVY